MMRIGCLLVVLLLTGSLSAAPPEVPRRIETPVLQMKRIDVGVPAMAEIGYQLASEDDTVFFDELVSVPGKRRFVFQASKPGTYPIVFWTKGETTGVVCTVVVTGSGVGPGQSKTPPRVSSIANQTLPVSGTSPAIPFTVSDEESPDALKIVVSSSDLVLLPLAGLLAGGTGTNRTLTLVPTAGKSGTATVTISVTNSANLTTSTTFVLTVGSGGSGEAMDPTLLGKMREALAKDTTAFGAGDRENARKFASVYAEAAQRLEANTAEMTIEKLYESMSAAAQAAEIPKKDMALRNVRNLVGELGFDQFSPNTLLMGEVRTYYLTRLKRFASHLTEAARQ